MQTIVISGANRGIGLALTRQFLQAGHHVIAGCRQPDKAAELLASPGSLELAQLDVGDAESVRLFCQQLGTRAVDVLVNNAGVMGGEHQGIHDMDYVSWLHTFEINTLAPFRLATALLPNLKRSERPRVATISSQMGAFGLEMGTGRYAYRTSKAAVSKAMQVLAQELAADNIIVCPLHPGWVRTDMGGPAAEISAEASAAGLFKLIDNLTMAQSGRFWTWEGREHVW
jgi:NAD(P)-dependent dehydrogenase (short-subunit alcohol dehydrogenase family)